MKVTKRQLRRIIIQERDTRSSQFSLDSEETGAVDDRHPKLDVIVDAVNDAKNDVNFPVLKDFLWNLNSNFANHRVIEGKSLNEQADIPEVEVVDEGGTLTVSPETATEVEAVIAQAFDVIDDLILAFEEGGYPRSTRGVALDPRLEKMKDQLEVAVEGLYEAQMQANHLIANTGG